ncbi:hypothetical protein U1Q18_020517, partial [Sarracenia purpurea var. burkii]
MKVCQIPVKSPVRREEGRRDWIGSRMEEEDLPGTKAITPDTIRLPPLLSTLASRSRPSPDPMAKTGDPVGRPNRV